MITKVLSAIIFSVSLVISSVFISDSVNNSDVQITITGNQREQTEDMIGARREGVWNVASSGYISPDGCGLSGCSLLIKGTNKYVNFNTLTGSIGYGFRDNAGTMEYKSSGGSWAQFSAGGGLSATAFSATSPLTLATTSSTVLYGMTQSSSSTDGYLSSTDWNTFNNNLPGVLENKAYISLIDNTHISIASGSALLRKTDGTVEEVSWSASSTQEIVLNSGELRWITYKWNAGETGVEYNEATTLPSTLDEFEQIALIGRVWKTNGTTTLSDLHIALSDDPTIAKNQAWKYPAFNISVTSDYSAIDSNYINLSSGELSRYPIVVNHIEARHIFTYPAEAQVTAIWGHLQNQSTYEQITDDGTADAFDIKYIADYYDNNGTSTALLPNKFVAHLLGVYASSNELVLFKGQHVYETMKDAEIGIKTDSITESTWASDGRQISKVAWIILRAGARDFSIAVDAKFVAYTESGGGGTGVTPWNYVVDGISYSDGYVGIGTTTPLSELHVAGSGTLTLGSYVSNPGGKLRVTMEDGDSNVQGIKVLSMKTSGTNYGYNGTAAGVGADNNIGLYAWASGATGNNYGLQIASGYSYFQDRIGVGISSPAYELDVDGTIQATDYRGILSDHVNLPTLGGIERDLTDYLNIIQGTGYVTGGAFSDNGDGTATVGSGAGFIKESDVFGATSSAMTWSASSSVALAAGTNYIYVDYNSGDPIIATSTTNPTDFRSIIHLGKMYKNGDDTIHSYQAGSVISEYSTLNTKRWIAQYGEVALTDGGKVAETGIRYLTVEAATLQGGVVPVTTSPIDTSGTDTFDYYYTDGANWQYISTTSTQINNTQYDNAGTLANLISNRYRTDCVYLDNDGHLSVILGTNNEVTLTGARTYSCPASPPNVLAEFATVIAKIIVQEGEANIVEIDNLETGTSFSSSGGVVHNETTGKQGGTADEYYHLDSADYTELTVWLGGVTLGATTITGLTSITSTSFVGALTGNADTATALAANGANCSAGNYPLGVDASGAVESCTADANTTYTGGTNLTLDGTTFNVDDSFLLNTGDIGTGVYDFGGATSFEIVNAVSPAVDTLGEYALDTTSYQTQSYTTAKRVLDEDGIRSVCISFASSTAIISGKYKEVFDAPFSSMTFYYQSCIVEDGTSLVVNLADTGGTNNMTAITCATTEATSTPSTNNVFTVGENARLEYGTNTGSATAGRWCGKYRITPN